MVGVGGEPVGAREHVGKGLVDQVAVLDSHRVQLDVIGRELVHGHGDRVRQSVSHGSPFVDGVCFVGNGREHRRPV